jgi:hypothetical protein
MATTADQGTWTYNPNTKMTEFSPNKNWDPYTGQLASSPSVGEVGSARAFPLESSGSLASPTGVGSTQLSTSNQNTLTTTGGSNNIFVQPQPTVAPPKMPNLRDLQALQDSKQRKHLINQALKSYDELSAITQASGFQSAQNAGNVYSQRMQQAGINPTASGVVAAQARLPVYDQLAKIGTEKATTKLDATNKSNEIAANIATTIAGIKLNYSKTLADFNSQQAQYRIDLDKFNSTRLGQDQALNQSGSNNAAGLQLDRDKLDEQRRQFDSTFAAQQAALALAQKEKNKFQGYLGFTPTGGVLQPSQEYGTWLSQNKNAY